MTELTIGVDEKGDVYYLTKDGERRYFDGDEQDHLIQAAITILNETR